MKKLESERLKLRKWQPCDLEDLFEYAKDERVGPNAGWMPHKTLENSKEILESFIASDEIYAIELKEEHRVIGGFGIHKRSHEVGVENDKQREFGFVLHPDYWGRGIMPEVVAIGLDYCFNSLGMEVIWCAHFDFNENSKRVIEKSAFVYQFSEEKELVNLGNKKVTSLVYAMTKKDYQRISK